MEFISIYIPREKSIDEIAAILREKSDSVAQQSDSERDVRNRLQDALKKIIQR